MLTIFCYTCHRSFDVSDKEIIFDNGSNMAVYNCPTCQTRYLLVNDDKSDIPIMFKLAMTKSHVVAKEISRIIKPSEVSAIKILGRK
jgi:DNA-directed RNA polymerase subunit RPC12/RpoP